MKRLGLLCLLCLLATSVVGQVDTGGLMIPGDAAVQVGRKSVKLLPPLDGLVDVWVWSDYTPGALSWPGSINNYQYTFPGAALTVASNSIANIGVNNNKTLFMSPQDMTFFAIMYKRNVVNTIGMFGTTTPVDFSANLHNTAFDWYDRPPRSGYIISVSGFSDFTDKWIEFEFYYPKSGASYCQIDGVKKTGAITTNASASFNLGVFSDATSNKFRGYVKCFAIYNDKVLDDETKSLIWAYLRARAGEYAP